MPQDNQRYWHDKEGYGGQGFVQEDQTFDWRAPDTEQYNAYAQQQAATSGQYLDSLRRGQDSYGEAMLGKGMGQASRAMASQAIGRGANPSAERAAIMAGADMAGQNNANAAALRAQEMQAARMAQMQNLDRLRQGEMGWAQLDAQMQQAAANHYAQMGQNNIARDAETRQVVGAAMGGAGGMIGGMISDERLKAAVGRVSPQAQDEIAQAYDDEKRARAIITGATMQRPTEYTPGLSDPLDADGRRYEVEQGNDFTAPVQAIEDRPLPARELYELRQQRAAERYNDTAGERYLQDAIRRAEAEAAQRSTWSELQAEGERTDAMLSDERLKAAVLSASPESQDEISSLMRRHAAAQRDGVGYAIGGVNQATGGAFGRASSALTGLVGGDRAGRGARRGYDQATRQFVNDSADGLRAAVGAEPKLHSAQRGLGDGARGMYDALADRLKLQRFRYADRARRQLGAPGGDRVGVMAQDMEESQLGSRAVNTAPDGTKSIDRDNALGLSLGLHGRAAERIDELEARLAKLQGQKGAK